MNCFINIKGEKERKKERNRNAFSGFDSQLSVQMDSNLKEEVKIKKKTDHYRSVKKHDTYIKEEDGTVQILQPEHTIWHKLYCHGEIENPRVKILFRTHFCIPYCAFMSLFKDASKNKMMNRWSEHSCDAVGKKSSNMMLLLLGSLRYMGRGFTFDDLEEATAISREVHRVFFDTFLEYGNNVLYKQFVYEPAKLHMENNVDSIFKLAGFDGCGGATDATVLPMLSCPSWASNMHKGFKMHVPARSFNITVTHCNQILSSTCGYPSTWNDKTLILLDEFFNEIRSGRLGANNVFELYEKDSKGNVVKRKFKGTWFIVDNGYLSWPCTIPPQKDPVSYKYIRFSEWIESIWKNVECTFGILKGRFSILKTGVRIRSIQKVDQLFRTCCALHNYLLFVDGLDKGWEEGTESRWQKECNNIHHTFPTQKLNRIISDKKRKHIPEDELNRKDRLYIKHCTSNGICDLNKLPFQTFYKSLVNHFDFRFEKRSVKWPKRFQHGLRDL